MTYDDRETLRRLLIARSSDDVDIEAAIAGLDPPQLGPPTDEELFPRQPRPYSKTTDQALARSDWIHRGTGFGELGVRTDHPEYVIDGSAVVLDYQHYAEQYRAHREWKG
ncbi:MAG TPA: hypothetical protein VI980_12040, partial [Acidimicrobiia bacterium]|nr:hypothetical protein [Acidimicrobiia bacterium]